MKIDQLKLDEWKNLLSKGPNRLISKMIHDISGEDLDMTSHKEGQINAFYRFWWACNNEQKTLFYKLIQDYLSGEGSSGIEEGDHPELKQLGDEILKLQKRKSDLELRYEQIKGKRHEPENIMILRDDVRKLDLEIKSLEGSLPDSFEDGTANLIEKLESTIERINKLLDQIDEDLEMIEKKPWNRIDFSSIKDVIKELERKKGALLDNVAQIGVYQINENNRLVYVQQGKKWI